MNKEEAVFNNCSTEELELVNGGLVGGAILGGIIGAFAGCVTAGVATICDGNYSGERLYKIVVASTTAGAAIGCFAPV
jgi:lactobin A/cerein 7B family class IIb bacteriocin